MSRSAIVILNYNGRQVLPTFLPSVIRHSASDCWIIDNASTDDSIDFLEENFPQLPVIQLKSNFGYTGGYNWGLEELRGKYDYFILLNSDVEVTPNWDVDLVEWLEKHPEYAALQPKILSWQDRFTFDYAGAGGGFLDDLGYPYCRGRIWNTLETDQGQYNDAIQVDWASGACLVIKAQDFFEQNGFDAHFFAHMEEIDLCWRLRRSGRKIGYLGSVTVYHQGGATLKRSSPRKLYLNIRNSLSMIYKNSQSPDTYPILFSKFLFEMAAAVGYLIKGQKDLAFAVLTGYRDFWKGKALLDKQFKNSEKKIPKLGPVRFVFWSYLIRGRKFFNQL